MLTPWFWTLAYRTVGKWISYKPPSLLWWLQRANPDFCCTSIQILYLSGHGRVQTIIVLEWAERVYLSKNILVTLIQIDLYMQKIPIQWTYYTSIIYHHTKLLYNFWLSSLHYTLTLVTHLFYNWKSVPHNLSHLFFSSPYLPLLWQPPFGPCICNCFWFF